MTPKTGHAPTRRVGKGNPRAPLMNINLNLGGILGGLFGAAASAGIVFGVLDLPNRRGSAKLVILGVVLGAFAGNFLWSLLAGTPSAPPDEEAASPEQEPGIDERDDRR